MPLKRIQRKVRRSDAYNDGSRFIPIVNESAAGRERSDLGAALAPESCGSRMDTAQRRVYIEHDRLTPENVHNANTVSLLGARARTLLAKYDRMRHCHENYAKQKFKFSSHEGDGTDPEGINVLRQINLAHLRRFHSIFDAMQRDPAAMKRWEMASKSSGKKNTMWEARDDAVSNELKHRKDDAHEPFTSSTLEPTSACAKSNGAGSSAQENTARAVHSAKSLDDVARI